MGELRGRPDQPPEEPDKSAVGDRVGPPGPEWNKTQDEAKLWRVIRSADDRFAMPGDSGPDKSRLQYEKPSPDDRPAERPPNGEELMEMDSPKLSRLDKADKQVFKKEFVSDAFDVTEQHGRDFLNLMPSDRPNAKAEVCVPMPEKHHVPEAPGLDGGELMAGMLAAGMVIGHAVLKVNHMRAEWKER